MVRVVTGVGGMVMGVGRFGVCHVRDDRIEDGSGRALVLEDHVELAMGPGQRDQMRVTVGMLEVGRPRGQSHEPQHSEKWAECRAHIYRMPICVGESTSTIRTTSRLRGERRSVSN